MTRQVKDYSFFMHCLLAIDQLLNVFYFNGHHDHTISGRVGYMYMATNKKRWRYLKNFIDTLFFFDENHCISSIEEDRKTKRKLYGWNIFTWLLTIWWAFS